MLSENIDNILINHTEMTNNDLEKTYNESDILNSSIDNSEKMNHTNNIYIASDNININNISNIISTNIIDVDSAIKSIKNETNDIIMKYFIEYLNNVDSEIIINKINKGEDIIYKITEN